MHVSNKRFFDKLFEALGLNQAYLMLKSRNNYYLVLICSFGSITGNIYYSDKQKVDKFFLYLDNTDDHINH